MQSPVAVTAAGVARSGATAAVEEPEKEAVEGSSDGSAGAGAEPLTADSGHKKIQ